MGILETLMTQGGGTTLYDETMGGFLHGKLN